MGKLAACPCSGFRPGSPVTEEAGRIVPLCPEEGSGGGDEKLIAAAEESWLPPI